MHTFIIMPCFFVCLVYFCFSLVHSGLFEAHLVYFRETEVATLLLNADQCTPDMITIRYAGWISGRMVICNRIRISKYCFQTGTGSGYPKRFYRFFEDSEVWKKLHIAHSFIIFRSIFSAFCVMTPSLSMV